MSSPQVLAALDRLIAQATPENRPGLVVALAARLATLGAGLAVPITNEREPDAADSQSRLLTPEEAATIASVSKTRIYGWARADGKWWASRPSRRCLRINETAFRRWLLTRNA